MKKPISILLLLFINVFPLAQNKIDQDLEKCLSQRNSTAGQISCVTSAQQSWDKELNKSYLSLNQKLNKTAKKELCFI